jgi:hypothetical protein
MPRFWSLKFPQIERLPIPRTPSLPSSQTSKRAVAAFFGTHTPGSFPGPALISSAVRNVVARQVSNGLSALRQPAHQSAAPQFHSPSPFGWPSCGGQCSLRHHGKQENTGTPGVFQSHVKHSKSRRPLHHVKVAAQWSKYGSQGGAFAVHSSNSRQGQVGLIPLPLRAPA